MLLSKTLVTPAPTEPVTIDEVKASARLDSDITELDGQIATLIAAARREAEQETCRQYALETWRLDYSTWPSGDLPLSPVSGLTSVEYLDGEAWVASDAFVIHQTLDGRARILQDKQDLPQLSGLDGAQVRVAIEVGYAICPSNIKAWIIARAVHMLTDTNGKEPPAYLDGLLDPERDWQ